MLPTQPLVLAHASDIHLDYDGVLGLAPESSRQHMRALFAHTLEMIVAQKPDLLVLPGDLFDSNRPHTHTVHWAMERLGALPFPVVLIPGNHDCLEPDGVFFRHDFSKIENVFPLFHPEGEVVDLPELNCRAWGKGMVAHTPDYQPLAGIAPPQAGQWNVGLGHGIYTPEEKTFRSSPIRPLEIERSAYDYLAFGHHHVSQDVSTPGRTAYYSGAPFPISPRHSGTFLIVNLHPDHPPRVHSHTLPSLSPPSL